MYVVLVLHVTEVTLCHVVTIDLLLSGDHESTTFAMPLLAMGGFVSPQLLPVLEGLWTRRAFVGGSKEFDWKGGRKGESDSFVDKLEMD